MLEEAAGVAGLHARRHEAELRLKAAETNLTRVEDVIGQLAGQIDGLKKQARQAIRYREVAAKVRKAEAMLFHLRWLQSHADVADAGKTHDLNIREQAERTREQAESARIQAIRASELPGLRENEARAAAGLQRLTNTREMLDREEARAKDRVTELDRRLTQFAADIEREQRQLSDADVALARLESEDPISRTRSSRASKAQRRGRARRRSRSDAGRCRAHLLRTDHGAGRPHRQAQPVRGQCPHPSRPPRATRSGHRQCRGEVQSLSRRPAVSAISAHWRPRWKPRRTCRESEADTQASETAHVSARAKLEASRAPLADAEKRVQRLETEAKTISKLVNGETKNLWPPIIDGVSVAKGFEKALGAALGDDLDAPVDPTAPMRWSSVGVVAGDPSLPAGVEALAEHVMAPPELARRLAQIGVVSRERGAQLVSQLKTGQRLVSREGDLWRWDGFVAAAHAPTGAARRLAERARLKDIESEIEQARADAIAKRQALETADAELKAASAAESAARDAARNAQREANAARERHAAAEREINRHAAHRSALDERGTRLAADRTEAHGAHESAVEALSELPSSAENEEKLAAVRADMDGHRRLAAQVRAEAQALAREAELADRRVQAIVAERNEWQSRKENAASQIATVETRIGEVEDRAHRT